MATTQTNPFVAGEPEAGGVRRSRMLDPVAMGFNRPPKKRGRFVFYFSMGWILLVLLGAIFADLLPIENYAVPTELGARVRPGFNKEFLGTDILARSNLSRIVFGARSSLAVGFGAVVIGMFVGSMLGITAGYFKGKVDTIVTIIVDSALAFPPLVLLLAISAMVTPTLTTIILQLAILSIPSYARLSRANTLAFAEREFVMAARAMGAKHSRILLKEIFPNVLMPLLVFAFLAIAVLMVAEGALSFLGAGVPPPTPSWGKMMSDGRPFLESDPHLVFVPSLILLVTIFSLNVIGDFARRRFDTKDGAL